MPDDVSSKLRDSALYRIATDVGFNARVEPLWGTYRRLEPGMGFFEKRRERRRLRRIVESVNAGVRAGGAAVPAWDDRSGDCVCNLRVAKIGLLREFKNYLLDRGGTDAPGRWPHVFALRDRPCLLVPVVFPLPVTVEPGGKEEPFPAASSIRARQELKEIDERLRIHETFALKKMVDYLDATERDISIYESRFGTSEGFWPKFCYVLLKKIVDVSVEKGLPAILV
jgi:hypothetical protein